MTHFIKTIVTGITLLFTISNVQSQAEFTLENVTAGTGSSFCMEVTAENLTDVFAIQFSINWDPALLEFTGVNSLNSLVSGANINTTGSSSGITTFSFFGGPITVPNNEVFFELCFDVLGTNGGSTDVEFTGNPTSIEVATLTNPNIGLTTQGGQVTFPTPLIFSMPDTIQAPGAAFCLPVAVENFNNLDGFQCAISWDPAVVQFDFVTNFNLSDLNASNFGTTPAGDGLIVFSWNDEDAIANAGVTVVDGTVIFEICFTVVGNVNDNTTVVFSGSDDPFVQVEVIEFGNPNNLGLTSLGGEINIQQTIFVTNNTITQPNCNDANGGGINIAVAGGTGPYTYIWSDNPINSPDRTGLSAGAYGVTVIDNGPNACESSITFVLLDNVTPTATVNITNPNNEVFISCAGSADGEVQFTVTPAGNTETIYDGNGMPQTNGQLTAGNYCIVVEDGGGCAIGESCFTVIEPDPILINVEVTNMDCNDPGGIEILAFGGTGFLLFDWADLPNSSDPQNRFNLAAGLYDLTVTDGNGCMAVVNDILVQDDCNTDCPVSSEEFVVIPINTIDTVCVTLDSCFVDSLTTYALLDGSVLGSSAFGSWSLEPNGCLAYQANDSAGVFIDTVCVVSTFNILTDTTCFIFTLLPACNGPDIIMEDSITLMTADCPAGADYCLEIDLAQVLNFNLTDNGQPFAIGNQGCNFDTTYFYSLGAFLNVAPNGPYTLTSWEVNGNTFTIDSFQMVSELVDSMNIWDPLANWTLNNGVITGLNSGSTYGSLDIIQLITGASTNLDVDINQIPNGTVINGTSQLNSLYLFVSS